MKTLRHCAAAVILCSLLVLGAAGSYFTILMFGSASSLNAVAALSSIVALLAALGGVIFATVRAVKIARREAPTSE